MCRVYVCQCACLNNICLFVNMCVCLFVHIQRGAVSPVVGRTLCTPAARVRVPGSASIILGVKTWLSTLEIVNLSVFRMRQ